MKYYKKSIFSSHYKVLEKTVCLMAAWCSAFWTCHDLLSHSPAGGTEGNTLYLKWTIPPRDLCKTLPIPPWKQAGGLRNPLTQSGVQRGNAHHFGQAGTPHLYPSPKDFRLCEGRLDHGCGEQVWGRSHRPGARGSWWKEMGPRKWGDTGWGKDKKKVYRKFTEEAKIWGTSWRKNRKYHMSITILHYLHSLFMICQICFELCCLSLV